MFFLIIKKEFNIIDNYLQKIDSLEKIDLLQKYIYSMFLFKSEYSIKSKFIFFNEQINNIFLTGEEKEEFINIFCKIQKTYFGLSRFAYLYKYKKSKIVVDSDLYLNQIDINNKNTICLLQEKNKYYFRINDLINIINRSLSNSPYFFCSPLIPKNPYNNVEFNKSTLYNIYFYIRSKTLIIPELLHKFFLCNFDLNIFEKDYEYLIREYAIINYVNDTDKNTIYNLIIIMIEFFNSNNIGNFYKIYIHPDFPKKELIDIMKPYLFLYCSYNFSLIDIKKNKSLNLFVKKMKKFYLFNPFFGRKYIKIKTHISNKKIKKFKNICSYNNTHNNFYKDN